MLADNQPPNFEKIVSKRVHFMDADGGTPAGMGGSPITVETEATPQATDQGTPGAFGIITPGRPSILKKPSVFSVENAATETRVCDALANQRLRPTNQAES